MNTALQMMPQNQMKDHPAIKILNLMTERDSAVRECELATSEKKAALAELERVIRERDAAIAERDDAIRERDHAIATLQHARDSLFNGYGHGHGSPLDCAPPGTHYSSQNQHMDVHPSPPRLADAPYDHARQMHIVEAYPISTASKAQNSKWAGKKVQAVPCKKQSKSPRKKRSGSGSILNMQLPSVKIQKGWKSQSKTGGGKDLNKGSTVNRDWKDQDRGLNEISFDESSMPVPVCSCTGKVHQCYRWGNCGWQSSCCTKTMSMYPLPLLPNKRHGRMGGRKMSGNAFRKLLNRLAGEGYDLSIPIDLKDHWNKHGTNGFITIK